MQRFFATGFAAILALSSSGCGQATNSNTATTSIKATVPSDAGEKLLLKEAPEKSEDVIAVREQAKDGDEVIIEGHIGGAVDPWVKDRAVFTIVDRSLVPCNERPGDDCKTPWDYCCDTDRLPTSLATVKFVDDQGKTLSTDARQLLGIKELQTVVVTGKAKRDEAGNLTVLATGLYLKPSPSTENLK